MMRRASGIGASDGIAIGQARILAARLVVVDRWIPPDQVEDEIERLRSAVEAADSRLVAASDQLEARHWHEAHAIVEAHRLILRSDEIAGGASKMIREEGLAAESAVRRIIDDIASTFEQMDDQYLRERGGDIEDVGERLLRTLLGLPEAPHGSMASEGVIGVGVAISAIDAFLLPRAGLAGLVTERGGKTSHAAIVVRGLEIPYVLGVAGLCHTVRPGDTLIVDGARGEVITNPDEKTLREYEERRRRQILRADRLRARPLREATTKDGVRIEVAANIESLAEIPHAVELGADAVGLFRTEFLYLDRSDLPSEEEQYRDAVSALHALGGRRVTFRTLDMGGEKLPLGLKVPSGANPSLGVRAIRLSFRRPDIFRTQLRALFRAAAVGPLRIMFPLISGITELQEAVRVCAETRDELAREKIPHDPAVPIGAMIETPSAALTTDHLAGIGDFFSIGTNDLIQYAFGADRDNPDVAHLYHPLHPAVLRLLKHAIDAAILAGKPISICGDMASEPAFTWILLGLGIRELSMPPRCIPAVKSVIAGTDLTEAQEIAAKALTLRSDREVEDLVLSAMRRRFPLEIGTDGDEPGERDAGGLSPP